MRRIFNFLLLFFLSVTMVIAAPGDLQEKSATLEGIGDTEKLRSDYHPEKHVARTTQQVDPKDPTAGTSTQRIIIDHIGYNRPTIIATEGHRMAYAFNSKYQEELSKLPNANLVLVEYRYLLESTPEPKNWDYLTAESSVCGLHNVRSTFKQICPGRQVSTGISKGGQTAVLYHAFFPDNVGFPVPYVGPLCKGVEDGRHEPFLRKVGTKAEHERIQDFQLEILKRESDILSLLESYCKNRNLIFHIPMPEVLDYCVLEYSFALRQWGASVSMIPFKSVDDQALLDHLMEISGPDYFAENQPNISFFVQTARELGCYSYGAKPFKKCLTIDSAHGHLNRIMLPEGLIGKVDFRPALYHKIYNPLKDDDPKMVFIYGEIDPWSAAMVPAFEDKKNERVYIQPRGSHRARIGNMPEDTKERILVQANKWLAE